MTYNIGNVSKPAIVYMYFEYGEKIVWLNDDCDKYMVIMIYKHTEAFVLSAHT